MQSSPFESEADRPGDRRQTQRQDADSRLTLQPPAAGEDDGQRRDETIEEPGYGHGV